MFIKDMYNTSHYKQIGKGTFSTVYRKANSSKVLIKSEDPVKECMALNWFPPTRLFPKVHRIKPGIYTMKYYPKFKVSSLNPKHKQLYRELRQIHNRKPLISQFKEHISNKTYRQYLIEAYDALCNYGTPRFEISPRNVSTTKSGRLILLDCFFIKEKLDAPLR